MCVCRFKGLAHCASCHLTANLWLCLTCGNLGCGRQQFGGVEGNSHGLTHFEATQHPVSVKLGTITPEGDAGTKPVLYYQPGRLLISPLPPLPLADVYCYACDDAKQDPEVAAHLAEFGIHIRSLRKTEKSMTELVRSFQFVYRICYINSSFDVANRTKHDIRVLPHLPIRRGPPATMRTRIDGPR